MISPRTSTRLLTFALFSIFLFGSCNNDDFPVVQFLNNGNVETGSNTPNNWFYSSGLDKYDVIWTDKESFSPTRSLSISTETSEPTDFAFWGQTFNANIPNGQSVTLSVWIKGNLTGAGVSLLIRGDDTGEPQGIAEQFAGTQGRLPIRGNFDWTEYSITLDHVDASTQSLTVYLVYMSDTTGEVYFDNIQLIN